MKIKRLLKLNIGKTRGYLAGVLVGIQLISMLGAVTGCGAAAEVIPDLIEPKASAQAYRPAAMRMIGPVQYMEGEVIAREYPCFSEKSAYISEMLVAVGDYVEEGDVIARSRDSMSTEGIQELNNQIASLCRQREKTKKISDETVKKLDFEKKIEKYLKNDEGVKAKDKEIQIEKENQRFNVAMLDSQINSCRSDLYEMQNESMARTFTAPHSGYVTYVANMTRTNVVEGFQNIAVISDYDDLYIESKEVHIDTYKFEDYKSKWAFINGKNVDIVETPYTNEEVAYASSISMNPFISFEVPGEKLALGTNVILCFSKEKREKVLAVGNDSIFGEKDEKVVYVKTADGKNEERKVELGRTDGNYTEVLSGISEGEEIFYSNTCIVPEKQEEVEVELATYTEICVSKMVTLAYPHYDIYSSDVNGKFVKMIDMGMASSGDALFSVNSSVENADIESVRLDMVNLDNDRHQSAKDYEKNRAEISKAIKKAKKNKKKYKATDTDAVHENMYLKERLECDLNILDIEEKYSKEDYVAQKNAKQVTYNTLRKGTINMGDRSDYVQYAQNDGRISATVVNSEDDIFRDGFAVTVERIGDDGGHTKLYSVVSPSADASTPPASARLTEKVTLKKEKRKWTGKCIGQNGAADRYMLFTRNGKPCVTYSAPYPGGVEYQFYTEMDSKVSSLDLEKAELEFNGKEMRNVVMVPSHGVCSEVNAITLEESNYVWKMENGVPVKEYVSIYSSGAATKMTYVIDGLEPGDIILK